MQWQLVFAPSLFTVIYVNQSKGRSLSRSKEELLRQTEETPNMYHLNYGNSVGTEDDFEDKLKIDHKQHHKNSSKTNINSDSSETSFTSYSRESSKSESEINLTKRHQCGNCSNDDNDSSKSDNACNCSREANYGKHKKNSISVTSENSDPSKTSENKQLSEEVIRKLDHKKHCHHCNVSDEISTEQGNNQNSENKNKVYHENQAACRHCTDMENSSNEESSAIEEKFVDNSEINNKKYYSHDSNNDKINSRNKTPKNNDKVDDQRYQRKTNRTHINGEGARNESEETHKKQREREDFAKDSNFIDQLTFFLLDTTD